MPTKAQLELLDKIQQLVMFPREFRDKYRFTNEEIASICQVSVQTVKHWFPKSEASSSARQPVSTVTQLLGIVDWILENNNTIKPLLDTQLPPQSSSN